MDFDTPYLTKQIIAYIGNKRRLLSLIDKAIAQSDIKLQSGMTFLDLFSGSGVVSRFAKTRGFSVLTNDWEPYSEVLSNAFLKTNLKDITTLFGSKDSFLRLLKKINTLPAPSPDEQYIARYYAPQSTLIEEADFRKERLFYSHENGLSIDKIRNYIDKYYSDTKDPRRNLLMGLLLYEAATHTNTSGVFKAFHKGFGGHGKDALSRILAPIELHEPQLIDSDFPVYVFREDSNTLVKKLPHVDIAYLDPPYNQHQYGSNYHILNTIVKWDKIPEPLELNEKGILKNKAGIRKDWILTRSAYCYRESAIKAFQDLIEKIDASLILVSYSSDGIIPFELMKDICMKKGFVSIVTGEYTTYRGGKQSNFRNNADIEFILAIETSKKSTSICSEKIDRIVLKKKVLLMFKRHYNRSRLLSHSRECFPQKIIVSAEGTQVSIPTQGGFLLSVPDDFDSLSNESLFALNEMLEICVCKTKSEEIDQLLLLLDEDSVNSVFYIRLIPQILRKLAQKKYREQFYQSLDKIELIKQSKPVLYDKISGRIQAVITLAEVRFTT